MQRVYCINERKGISNQTNIKVGECYYLDLETVNGDFDGDWYGQIYADSNKNEYIGHLKLSHFRSDY